MRKRKRYIGELSLKAELDLTVQGAGISMGSNVCKAEDLPKDEMLSFWGASPNTNNFQPDISLDDILPKPEDFYRVPFRLLSATVVGAKTWKATDFSNISLLKNSKDKLVGKPIYFDHDQAIMNWVGVIESVSWEDEKIENGQKIPAGINGILLIDGKTNPKIIRGIAMGAVFSNSVTVKFEWEQSHTFESPYEFYDKLGTSDDKGMVRRIVVDIKDYHETSLVWLGADPYAKLINKDGKLVNPDTTSAVSFSKVPEDVKKRYEDEHKMVSGLEIDESILPLSKRNYNFSASKQKQNKKDMEFSQLLTAMLAMFGWTEDGVRAMLGLSKDAEITEEAFKGLVDEAKQAREEADMFGGLLGMKTISLSDDKKDVEVDFGKEVEVSKDNYVMLSKGKYDALTALSDDLASMKTEKEGLETEVKNLKADAKLGNEYISMKREEVKRLYKASVDDADDAVVALMDKANSAELDGLLKQYVKDSTGKFSGKCKACGSNEFEFRSTFANTDDGGTGTEEAIEVATFGSLYAQESNASMDISKKKNKKED